METTKIEWADATFNPWMGCTAIGPGCDHCYAEAMLDTRRHVVEWGAGKPRKHTSPAYWRQPRVWDAHADLFFECSDGKGGGCGFRGEATYTGICPRCQHGHYTRPARRRVFCASLADVFDNEVDPGWRSQLFHLIGGTPNLDWLLLTKRIGNADAMIRQAVGVARVVNEQLRPWVWPNVWIGATVCNQAEAERDIPKLLALNAYYRFLSCEPLLGPIDLTIDGLSCVDCPDCNDPDEPRSADPETGIIECRRCDGTGKGDDLALDWVIAGGESGHHARPMHPDWARQLRDQCAAGGVPFLFKQWGEYLPGGTDFDGKRHTWEPDAEHCPNPPADYRVSVLNVHGSEFGRLGKKRTGRTLDGRTHDGFPG